MLMAPMGDRVLYMIGVTWPGATASTGVHTGTSKSIPLCGLFHGGSPDIRRSWAPYLEVQSSKCDMMGGQPAAGPLPVAPTPGHPEGVETPPAAQPAAPSATPMTPRRSTARRSIRAALMAPPQPSAYRESALVVERFEEGVDAVPELGLGVVARVLEVRLHEERRHPQVAREVLDRK